MVIKLNQTPKIEKNAFTMLVNYYITLFFMLYYECKQYNINNNNKI